MPSESRQGSTRRFVPYYEDDAVSIYHGDCRAILPVLAVAPALVLTDPPYGVSERTDRHSKGRDNGAVAYDFPPIGGPARLIPHRWKGLIKASERADQRVHPTQKPIALMGQIIEWLTK